MKKLSIKQELVIIELLKGKSIIECSNIVNISIPTINRWLADINFKEELNNRKNNMINLYIDKINSIGDKAIKVLDNVLCNTNNDNLKVNISKYILDMLFKFNEQKNIVDKIDYIENIMKERNVSND